MTLLICSVLPPVLVPRVKEFDPNYDPVSYQQPQPMETGDNSMSLPKSNFNQQSPHSPFSGAASTLSSGAPSPYQVNFMAGKCVNYFF